MIIGGTSRGLSSKALARLVGAVMLLTVQPCLAQAPAAASATSASPRAVTDQGGTRIILLGTGAGPVARKNRAQPANLLIVEGRPYLIDAGATTLEQLTKAGFAMPDINRLFITHLHFDHTVGIPELLAFHWTIDNNQKLEIYGPPGTKRSVEGALQFLAPGEELHSAYMPMTPGIRRLIAAHDMVPVSGTPIYQDDLVRVFAVENSHYATIPIKDRMHHNWRSYSFRFETSNKTVVFTGDTGPSEAVTELARDADVLVAEVLNVPTMLAWLKQANPKVNDAELQMLVEHMIKEHLSPKDVGMMAAKAGVKKLVLSHIAPGNYGEDMVKNYIDDVKKYYSGIIEIGDDLDQF